MSKGWLCMEGQAAGGLSCIMSSLKWNRRSSADVRIIIVKISSHTIFLACFVTHLAMLLSGFQVKLRWLRIILLLLLFSWEICHWSVQSDSVFIGKPTRSFMKVSIIYSQKKMTCAHDWTYVSTISMQSPSHLRLVDINNLKRKLQFAF